MSAHPLARILVLASSLWLSDGLPVERMADVGVAMIDLVDPAVAGGVQLYEIEVANLGPEPATGTVMQQELPRGALFLGAEPTSARCALLSGVLVECQLGTLRPSETVKLTVGVLIDHRIDGVQTSGVAVAANEVDPVIENDEAGAETSVAPVRKMVATTRDGRPAIAMTAKEGHNSVSLVFENPDGGGDRKYSVESTGYRAASLAVVKSFAGSRSPEVAALAAGFDGSTRVVIVDAGSQQLVAEHDVAGDWLALEIVALESFAGSGAPELVLLLEEMGGSTTHLVVIDASSGAVVRHHTLAGSSFPIAVAVAESLGGTASDDLLVLSRSPLDGAVRITAIDPDSGAALGTRSLGAGLFPFGIVALEGGDGAFDAAALVRRASDGDLYAIALDLAGSNPPWPVDFDDTLLPAVLMTLARLGGSDGPALVVVGREGANGRVSMRDVATGAEVRTIDFGSSPGVAVPLDAAHHGDFDGDGSPELSILFEPFGEPTQVWVFDVLGTSPLATFALP